jgi:hypothetical protein
MIRQSDLSTRPLPESVRSRARLVFFVFVLTFIASRVLVFLIMARRIPDVFVHLGGTHLHHLNYGIFLVCGVSGYLLFAHPRGRSITVAAVLYAVGLALTCDEFGMWLHLGGSYWQRSSFDAVTVVATILGLLAFSPRRGSWRGKHWLAAASVAAAALIFFVLLAESRRFVEREGPRLEQIEHEGPS